MRGWSDADDGERRRVEIRGVDWRRIEPRIHGRVHIGRIVATCRLRLRRRRRRRRSGGAERSPSVHQITEF